MTPPETYYESTSVPFSARPRLMHDIDTDVCIIGGGFAGLWTARALQKRHREVVLVEQGRIAGGASGRNGGFVSAGFNQGMNAIADRVGIDHARALYRLSRMGVDLVKEEAALGMPGTDQGAGYLRVSIEDDAEGLQRSAERYARLYDHDMEFWPAERVRDSLKSESYYQALHDADAFHVHPLNLAIAMAEDIERKGGRIYEDTPALDADLDGVRKVVRTPNGMIRAQHVVVCANDIEGEGFPKLQRSVMPVATYLCVTRPLGDKLAKVIRYKGCVQDSRRAFNYYRLIGDRILWGCGISTNLRRPKNLEEHMCKQIAATYPQLAGVSIESAWSGIMGFSVHRMPQIGMLNPGAWIASAFGGQGLNTTAMAGELIASAIAEKDERWRLFIPFGLVWTGGALGRAFAQASWRKRKLLDRWDDLKKGLRKKSPKAA